MLLAQASLASVDIRIIDGARADLIRTNIEALLSPSFGSDRDSLKRYARHVTTQADLALQALGYYQPQIRTSIEQDGDKLKLVLEVRPGPVIRIGYLNLQIYGDLMQLGNFRIPAELLPQPGDPLNHGDYEDAKTLLLSLALNRGYLDASFVQKELLIDTEKGEAYITLVMDSGHRYYLGEVTFSDGKLNESLLRRYVTFKPGTPYDIKRLNRLNQDMQESGYFDHVRVSADARTAQDYVIPVEVITTDTRRNKINIGGGISTDVGVRAKIDWTNVRLNELGHRIGANAAFSQYETSFNAWWMRPNDRPQTDRLTLRTGWLSEIIDATQNEQFTLGADVSARFSTNWQQTVSLDWAHSEFNVGEASSIQNLLIPGVTWTRRITDGTLDPDQGFYATFRFNGSDPWLSTLGFVKGAFDFGGLVTPFDRQRFKARLQLGAMSTEDFDDLPPSLRFYAGGDQSVRGYDYRSLGPVDDDGEVTGGTHLIVGGAEYSYEIIPNWRLATFIDHGNTGFDWQMPLYTGVGAGVHWSSPIGPVRLDFAWGITKDPVPWRIHLSMGPGI